jgi:hypothetical protein
MTDSGKKALKSEEKTSALRTCFVVAPISDAEGYAPEHFDRVYSHLIKPACVQGGFKPIRSDETKRTNHIVIEILQKIISSDMLLCDLSSRNPNVMYELGIRQAFNKPVVLIKDRKTERVFDIQGLRTFEYDESLRVDLVQDEVKEISEVLRKTADAPKSDVNSLIELLAIKPANLPQKVELSERDSLIMNAIRELGDRIDSLNNFGRYSTSYWPSTYSVSASSIPTEIVGSVSSGIKPYVGASTFALDYATLPPERRVEELWNTARNTDLIGKTLLLDGVSIGTIVEANSFSDKVVFLDGNNLQKSVARTDPRFKHLVVRASF